jgi:hypothetical protein
MFSWAFIEKTSSMLVLLIVMDIAEVKGAG